MEYKKAAIIDRTIPEIYKINEKVSRLDMINFCWMLVDLGVNRIELDMESLHRIGKLPVGIEFSVILDEWENIRLCKELGVRYFSIPYNKVDIPQLFMDSDSMGLHFAMDFHAEDLAQIRDLRTLRIPDRVEELRIAGLSCMFDVQWTEEVKDLQICLQRKIGIFPSNRHFDATACAFEAMASGMDSVTVSFAGLGGDSGYAALEELITAYSVLIDPQAFQKLSILADFNSLFSKLTGINFSFDKPVIGRGIFHYESGIHADGIHKDTSTYEPFSPEMVGQKRKLVLGKHSGRRSVMMKLEELGIYYEESNLSDILERVRNKSISLKRNLTDEEICRVL